MPTCASPPAQDSDARQEELQNAAPTTTTRKDKRSHKGRRQMEDSFMIHLYKVKMCTRTTPHNWKLCPWAHPGEAAARRHPSCHQADLCHAVRMCPLQNKGCPHGESCAWSRNIFEAHLHPDRYRTVMCAMGESCSRNICFFAHNEQELRSPPAKATPSSLAPLELPLNADVANDGYHPMSFSYPGGCSSSANSAASNILLTSSSDVSNSAASNIIGSSGSNISCSSNAASTPTGRKPAALYLPCPPGSASLARSSAEYATSPAAATGSAALAALHAGAAVSAPAAMPMHSLMDSAGMHSAMSAAPVLTAINSGAGQQSRNWLAASESSNDLLSLQQQIAGKAAAAAAFPHSPTAAAAMQVYADAVSGATNAAVAAAAAAAGLGSPLAAAVGSPLAAAVGSPPTAHSPLLASGSLFATSAEMKQHHLLHSPAVGSPLQQQLLGLASPHRQLAMQQEEPGAAVMQQMYQSQVQAAAANAAAAGAAAAGAVAAAGQPGLNSLAAGIMQQRQLEASSANFTSELLAAQSLSAMQAAVRQQQQQVNGRWLQELALAGTAASAAPCVTEASMQCMSPQVRAAAWEAQAVAAEREQQRLQGMMLLAGLPEQAAGFRG